MDATGCSEIINIYTNDNIEDIIDKFFKEKNFNKDADAMLYYYMLTTVNNIRKMLSVLNDNITNVGFKGHCPDKRSGIVFYSVQVWR
jgi:hypothetical protein